MGKGLGSVPGFEAPEPELKFFLVTKVIRVAVSAHSAEDAMFKAAEKWGKPEEVSVLETHITPQYNGRDFPR